MYEVGLKHLIAKCKGCGWKRIIDLVVWELIYALQRMWRGYDELDVMDLDNRLMERLRACLIHLKRTHSGSILKPAHLRGPKPDDVERGTAAYYQWLCFSSEEYENFLQELIDDLTFIIEIEDSWKGINGVRGYDEVHTWSEMHEEKERRSEQFWIKFAPVATSLWD